MNSGHFLHFFGRFLLALFCALCFLSGVGTALAADPDARFYGSLRLGLDYVDAGTVDDGLNGRDYLSRIGVRGTQALPNGLTGLAQIEYGMRSDNLVDTEQNDGPSLRLAFVGVEGDFGRVYYGSQTLLWHRFVRSSYFSDLNDSIRLLTIRDDDLLQYYRTAGGFTFGAGIQAQGQDGYNIDLIQAGAEYASGPLKLQAAVLQDRNGVDFGVLYGARAWFQPNAQLGFSAYWHAQDRHFDYRAGSTGNVRLRDARVNGNVNGVDNCPGERRTNAGVYGKGNLHIGYIHARYAVDRCQEKGDIRSIKVEYVQPLGNAYRYWVAYEQLESDPTRLPVTGSDLSELQLGVRFDFE